VNFLGAYLKKEKGKRKKEKYGLLEKSYILIKMNLIRRPLGAG